MTNEAPDAETSLWLSEPMPSDVAESLSRLTASDDVRHVAVMPDVHLAGDVCNGTVVATHELIYPSCVGGDIGCGMAAIAFDLEAELLDNDLEAGRVLARCYERIPSNKHARAALPERLPATLADAPLTSTRLEKIKSRDGLFQLGTLGRGNHFVELQADPEGRLWLMVHSGSRAMGQAITAVHVAGAETTSTGLPFLEAASVSGQAYLSDLAWALEYAAENRLAMVRAVSGILNELFSAAPDEATLIHCHHNHVRRETHCGDVFWVHRKGALSAEEGEPGVIPGSMGSRSYHVAGRGAVASLRSSSHGAGRSRARHLARQAISRHDLEREMFGVRFDHRRADALRDEAPSAYKEIGRVMRAQRELTRIVRELRPLLVYKGT
jgi:tRNA-splicing ligase RtcB